MFKFQNKTQNAIKLLRNFNTKTTDSGGNVLTKLDDKVKGTFMEKWVKFWKTLFNDYKDVALDVFKEAKEKPLKAALIASSFTGVYYCAKHNPDEKNFRDAFLKAANEVLLVNPKSQNPKAVNHLNYIEEAYNHKLVRRLNCGVFSIIWEDLYSNMNDNYEAHCDYTQLRYSEFTSRILDVGFLDRWWILSDKMVDYDINY